MMKQGVLDIKKYIALSILLIVNFQFFVKYLERVTPCYLPLSVLCILALGSIMFLADRIEKCALVLKSLNIILVASLIAASCYVFYKIPIETVNVDRWKIITSFWQTFEKGEYTYGLQLESGNRPGAMPFYFLIAYPFYLIGEFGLMPIVALLIFIFTLKYVDIKRNVLSVNLWFLILSPSFLWEIASRSTLYLNAVLVLFSVVYFLKDDKPSRKRLIISGILFGLFLSIRFVFVLAYAIMALYALHTKRITLKDALIVALFTILAFASTFMPFAWGHFDEFLAMNPFIIQSTFLVPFGYTIVFGLIALVFSFCCKKTNDVYFYSSAVLFISILVYEVYFICLNGFYWAFFKSVADISYFIFCIPFALFYYAKRISSKII